MSDHRPLRAPALDPRSVPGYTGTTYPPAFRSVVSGRHRRALGDALGLETFGVNLVRLDPGAASSLRHWHTRQDEFIYVLEGELVLVSNGGEQRLAPGMCGGFPAGSPDGHQLVNRTASPAVYLEVGDRLPGDRCHYSDVDLLCLSTAAGEKFVRRDGTPYDNE
jgi:uncharacterized cupin superfamily protein